MNHDLLFKELLRLFLPAFLRLFFPAVARKLDFSRLEFVDKETFTDFLEGAARDADVVALVHTKQGEPELILLHVEIESRRRGEFGERMWEYYHLLRLRRRVPVFPIVVYLAPGSGGLTRETYKEVLWGQTIETFRYNVVGLRDLAADDYRLRPDPLAVALAALMKPSAAGRLEQKWQALLAIARARANDAERAVLATVVESYLELSVADKAALEARLAASREVKEVVVTPYEERGRQIGIAEGIQQGIAEGLEAGARRGQQ